MHQRKRRRFGVGQKRGCKKKREQRFKGSGVLDHSARKNTEKKKQKCSPSLQRGGERKRGPKRSCGKRTGRSSGDEREKFFHRGGRIWGEKGGFASPSKMISTSQSRKKKMEQRKARGGGKTKIRRKEPLREGKKKDNLTLTNRVK